jgi:hypothetical protein
MLCDWCGAAHCRMAHCRHGSSHGAPAALHGLACQCRGLDGGVYVHSTPVDLVIVV